jgi:hypothetical protein
MALMRYKEKGTICKLARGLYYYPKVDPILGFMLPSTDDTNSNENNVFNSWKNLGRRAELA